MQIEKIVPINTEIEYDFDEAIGIDLGLTHFAILSNGQKIENPRFYRENLKKLAKMQRRLSKMTYGSQNYIKQKRKIAKLHNHIANMRKDFLHKISRKLIDENQVIVLEDLNVKGMLKNKRLAKSIQDVGWGTFKIFLKYKAEWAYSFMDNPITSLTLSNKLTTIPNMAFSYNKLTSVTIPNGVTSIATTAFGNNEITTVSLPNSLTSIGVNAFTYNKITSITIPSSVTSIGNSAFQGNQLTTLTIPNSVKIIGDLAFQENFLTSVTIGSGVTSIGSSAFKDNKLTSIKIPSSVTSIGFGASYYNSNLKTVTNCSALTITSYFQSSPTINTNGC